MPNSPFQPNFATDAEVQNLILTEFALTGDSVAVAAMPIWWNMSPGEDGYNNPSQVLQYLFTKKRVIMYLLAKIRAQIDVTIGTDKFSANQQVKNLAMLMKLTCDEILVADPGAGIAWLESAHGENKSAGVGKIHDFFSREFYLYWESEWQLCFMECFGFMPRLPFSGNMGMYGGYYNGY